MKKRPIESAERDSALTPTSTYDDGEFIRTSLVIGTGEKSGSIDIVSAKTGKRVAQLNVFVFGDDNLIVDVIDVDERNPARQALFFPPNSPSVRSRLPKGATLVSVDFRKKFGAE